MTKATTQGDEQVTHQQRADNLINQARQTPTSSTDAEGNDVWVFGEYVVTHEWKFGAWSIKDTRPLPEPVPAMGMRICNE